MITITKIEYVGFISISEVLKESRHTVEVFINYQLNA